MSKIHTLLVTLFLIYSLSGFCQNTIEEPRAYSFYDSSGTELSYSEVIARINGTDVLLFGELHNNPVIHWLQKLIINDLSRNNEIVLGAEFFETDQQLILNEYLAGFINDKQLESGTHLWPNYATDYKAIVETAKDSGWRFIGTNIPRRYASLVAKYGLDTLSFLSKNAKALLPKLPVKFSLNTPGYSDLVEMMQGHGHGGNPQYFAMAQAVKDATMAGRILEHREKDELFIHINGDFHSANYGGIYWYLKEEKPQLNVFIIKAFSSENQSFSNSWKGSGDVILVVPESFPVSY